MWHTWKTRCNVVFENSQVQIEEIANSVKTHIADWTRTQITLTNRRRESRAPPRQKIWRKPDIYFIKVNFDAAWCKFNKLTGIELICRNFTGASNGARRHCTKVVDSQQAEALEALEAVALAKEKGIVDLHLKGDSQRVVNAINGKKGAVKWTNASIIQDAIHLLNSFTTWKCSFIHRDGNNVADTITKKVLSFTSTQEWQHDKPIWSSNAIHSDNVSLSNNS